MLGVEGTVAESDRAGRGVDPPPGGRLHERRPTGTRLSAAAPRRLVLAAAVVGAVLPVVTAGVRAVGRGWIPTWDRAYPALRAWDVFTAHSPLLGTRSTASDYGSATSHPGPLEFQVLAPWVRVFGLSDGTALGVAFLNALCVVAVAWLAYRRGGQLAALLATAAMATLAWSMGSEMLYDPWPPHVVLFPFAVFLTAAWSTADNDLVALPVLAVSGSFVLQTHLGYAVLVPGIVLISLGMLGARLMSERRRATPTSESSRPRRRRWGGIAAGTALACWAFPLIEQITGRYGGNMGSLIDAATSSRSDTASLGTAVRLVGGTVALPPWWLPPSFGSPAVDVMGEGVSLPLAVAGLCILVAVLVACLRRARRRERTALSAGLGMVLGTIPLAVYTTDNAPLDLGIQVGYVRYLWVLAAFLGLMLALALADEVRHCRSTEASVRRVAPVVIAVVTVVAGVLAVPYADRGHDDFTGSVMATRSLAAQLLDEVDGEPPLVIEMSGDLTLASWVGPGLLVELQEAGVPFVVRSPALIRQLGNYRAYNGRNAELRLSVVAGRSAQAPRRLTPTSPRPRVVASFDGLTPSEHQEFESLRIKLRDAIVKAGGLPLNPYPSLSDDFPVPRDEVYRLIGAVEALGDDPDDILESDELAGLLVTLELGYADVDDVFDREAVPTDDLIRYGQLRYSLTHLSITVYLDELPPP